MKNKIKNTTKWLLALVVAVGFLFTFTGLYKLLVDKFTPLSMLVTGLVIIILSIIFGVTKFSEIPKWLIKKVK